MELALNSGSPARFKTWTLFVEFVSLVVTFKVSGAR